jgi:hypothetical protein
MILFVQWMNHLQSVATDWTVGLVALNVSLRPAVLVIIQSEQREKLSPSVFFHPQLQCRATLILCTSTSLGRDNPVARIDNITQT